CVRFRAQNPDRRRRGDESQIKKSAWGRPVPSLFFDSRRAIAPWSAATRRHLLPPPPPAFLGERARLRAPFSAPRGKPRARRNGSSVRVNPARFIAEREARSATPGAGVLPDHFYPRSSAFICG